MSNKELRNFKDRYSRFSWNEPFGYDFEEVEKAIGEYKTALSDAGELILKKDSVIKSLQEENNRLTKELTNLQIQLESIDVPIYDDKTSIEILNDFQEEYNKTFVERVQEERIEESKQNTNMLITSEEASNNKSNNSGSDIIIV